MTIQMCPFTDELPSVVGWDDKNDSALFSYFETQHEDNRIYYFCNLSPRQHESINTSIDYPSHVFLWWHQRFLDLDVSTHTVLRPAVGDTIQEPTGCTYPDNVSDNLQPRIIGRVLVLERLLYPRPPGGDYDGLLESNRPMGE